MDNVASDCRGYMIKCAHDFFETKQLLNILVILSIAERAHNNTDSETCNSVLMGVVDSPIHRLINEVAEKLDSAIAEEANRIRNI